MKELRRKVVALLDRIPDKDLLVELLADVYFAAFRANGGRPRNGSSVDTNNAPTTSPDDDETSFPDVENPKFDPSYSGSDLSLSLVSPESSKTLICKRESDERDDPDFLTFWDLYPKKVGKSEARRAWKRRRPPIARAIATLTWQRASLQWQQGIIPNPATWINQGRWEDEPPTDMRSNGYSERSIATINGITRAMEDLK